jgi:transmembrane sensor
MKTNYSIEEPGWELMAKYLAGEATVAEQEKVQIWANLSEKNQRELEKNRMLLEKTDWFYQMKKFNTSIAWNIVYRNSISQGHSTSKAVPTMRFKIMNSFFRYAAILLLAILVGSLGYYFGLKNQPGYSEIISAEKQVINEYILPDGSVVALNSNSKLRFPKDFNSDTREVSISGEAFFDVKHNPEKPFLINAGNIQVKVLGTSFNVSAYPGSETVEVVVESGLVQVISNAEYSTSETPELMLNAGEKGTLMNSHGKLEKSLNTDPNYLAWKTHNITFDKTPLDEVVKFLSKMYHIDIYLENENLKNLVLTAQFERKSHDFILNVIQLTFGLELTRENGAYVFSENKKSNM